MRGFWIVVVVASGCVKTDSIACDDQRTCPSGTTCDDTHALCVLPEQLAACVNAAPGAACTAGDIAGFCTDGVCLAKVCGDSLVEGDEACDDGNQQDGDGCSSNCASTELCGNGTIDSAKGEECDDGNHLEHDGCSSRCKLETPHWIQHASAPPGRSNAVGASDTYRDRIVMFGGLQSSATNETWEYTGMDWVLREPTTRPSPRYFAAMTYDRDHRVSILFGGNSSQTYTSDTWLWNGSDWASAGVTGAVPPPRQSATFVYDPIRHRGLLFGGDNGADNLAPMADTWEWNGDLHTWTQNTDAIHPAARADALAAFDPKLGKIVLTGGTDTFVHVFSDTWTYDGSWHDISSTAGPGPQTYDGAATFDLVGQRIVAFTYAPAVTTWAWNSSTWTKLTTTGLTAPNGGGLVLGATSSRVVLYGSATNAFLSGSTYSTPFDSGQRLGMVATLDPIRGRVLMYGGGKGATNLSATQMFDTMELSPAGLVQSTSGSQPALRAEPYNSITYDPKLRLAVMFGSPSAAVGESWTWSGAMWTKQATAPAQRSGMVLGFDGQHVQLVGGTNASSQPLGDYLTFDGTAWTQGPTIFPSGRSGSTGGFDHASSSLALFSGGPSATADTYLFANNTLSLQMPGDSPTQRNSGKLVWNAARRRLTLICGDVPECDSYEWDGMHWSPVPIGTTPAHRIGHAAFSSLDGSGIMMFGGDVPGISPSPIYNERWELRWEAADSTSERCNDRDLDGDGLVGCADPDCWPICAPTCAPGDPCDATAPSCGDGVCDQRESCATCAVDCGTCSPVCGDGRCETGETCLGDCMQ